MQKVTTVDAYIAAAPPETRPMLEEMRSIFRSAAPSATEKISYDMPTYEFHGRRLHFAGAKSHVGVYGLVHVDSDIPEALRAYVDNRSTLRFPLDRPLPVAAIRDAIERRISDAESRK